MLLGELALWQDHQHEQAVAALEEAVTLDPNFADAYFERGHILTYAGEPERAIASIQTGMRLDPHHSPGAAWMLGRAYTLTGRYTEAIPIMQRVVSLAPEFLPAYVDLAINYTRLGQPLKAQAAAAAIMRLNPATSLEQWKQTIPFKDPAILDRAIDDLRKAGLK
jgi:tetratricopeptide (TPR) repeat protein